MKSELVEYYNDELSSLRKEGLQFAEQYPKIASRLKLSADSVEDPLVGRLVESVAFLTSRLRYQLDASKTEFDENLLQLLYPHYFSPIPSCSTIQFSANDQLDQAYLVPKNTLLATPYAENNYCYFSTVYPVTVRPLAIKDVHYRRETTIIPKQHMAKELKSCLSFTLVSNKTALSDLGLSSIRLFINADLAQANLLRELLLARTQEIILTVNNQQFNLPVHTLQAVGFTADESLLPEVRNSLTGQQLLLDYFTYPEKFLYIDLVGLDAYLTDEIYSLEMHCFFDHYYPQLTKQVTDDTLQLHCAPIVNIFKQMGEPISFDQTQTDYHLVPDVHRDTNSIEIYQVNSVDISSVNYRDVIDTAPYFGRTMHHRKAQYLYWHAKRVPCSLLGDSFTAGDEVFLNISDFNLQDITEELILNPELLCTNRNIPELLPFGGGKPDWQFHQTNHELIDGIHCLKRITASKHRAHQHQRQQLVQQIALNQVGVAEDQHTLENIKSLLTAYRFVQPEHHDLLQAALINANCQVVTLRHPAKLQQGFCRGLKYQLTIDVQQFADNDVYLFGSILHQFLTQFCSINSLALLEIYSQQQELMFTWQPLSNNQPGR